MPSKQQAIEREVRALLDAMDAQWGQPLFSLNVDNARAILRARFPHRTAEENRSREKEAA